MNLYLSSYLRTITKPADFFKEVDDRHSAQSLLLVAIMGIMTGLNNYLPTVKSWESMVTDGKFLMHLMMILLPVIGVFFSTILYAGLLNWVADKFKPVKKTDDESPVRMALPFTYIPTILFLAVSLFIPNDEIRLTLNIIVMIWSYGLVVLMIAVVKQVDYLKAFLITVLAVAVVVVPVAIIYGSFVWLKG